jgi:hypothetical protein
MAEDSVHLLMSSIVEKSWEMTSRVFRSIAPRQKGHYLFLTSIALSLSLLIENLGHQHKKETKTQDTIMNTNDEMTAAPTNMHLPPPSRLPLSIVLLITTVAPQSQGSFSCSSSRQQLLCNRKHRP